MDAVHSSNKSSLIRGLQNTIQQMEGHGQRAELADQQWDASFLKSAFPDNQFPTGTVHEFLALHDEDLAATTAFLAGLIVSLNWAERHIAWVGNGGAIYPAALHGYGLRPENILFIDAGTDKEHLWVLEETLKCRGLCCVIAELDSISFSEGRRLQLLTEKSMVTAFIIQRKKMNAMAMPFNSRWKISCMPSVPADKDMPGVAKPRWNVELVKVKHGRPAAWQVEWRGALHEVDIRRGDIITSRQTG